MNNCEAPFGLESLDLAAPDRLMAERQRRSQMLFNRTIQYLMIFAFFVKNQKQGVYTEVII